MRFSVLGPLEVVEGGRRVVLGGPKPRAVLAILLVHRGEVVPFEKLIDELYGGAPPARAAKSVQVHVSRLRKSLGGARLRTVATGYTLDVHAGELDLDAFAELVERGRHALSEGDAASAASTLRQALALWRGPPFADFRYQEFAQAEIARLEEQRLGAIEDRIDADLALGRHADLVPELEGMVAQFPLRERLRAQLMLALYRCGRQAEALDAYTAARRVLTDELGLDPSDELKGLQRAILEHDPSLAAPRRIGVTREVQERDKGDFVGRVAELSSLRAALENALAGRGRLVLVSGDPGIGKSRLADELIAEARAREVRVLVGRCWEAGGAPAYWPWIQSLRVYIGACTADVLRTQLGSGGSDLAQLFPELFERFPDLPPPPSLESEGARFRLFDAATAFLKAAARDEPLVVVLDDLHVADEPSLLLLRFLTRELGDGRLLVLGLYRDVDPTLREPLAPALAELAREPVTRRLHLTGLASAEVADFVERTTDTTPAARVVTAIYEETDGNPLFVGEIVRLLAAEGRLEAADAELSIPQGIREVIERRILRLGERTANLLTLASVLGREFDLDVLARLGGESPEEVLSALDEALTERVVGDVPGARGRLRFAHEVIRDTLYDVLGSARRVRLHGQAGEALEQIYGESSEPHLAELAHHFTAAASGGDVQKAVEYCRRAAERAATLLAYEEAVRLYESALTLTRAEDAGRCELLLALGDAQARAGDTPGSNATLREAAELAERLRMPEHLARAALGYGGRIAWDVSRDDPYVVELLERALAAIGDAPTSVRVRLLARLAAGPLRDSRFPPERKAAVSEEALEMARSLGDPSALAYALFAYTQAHLSPETVEERLEATRELVEVAMAAGDKERAFEGHEERILSLLSVGDRSGADAELSAIEALADELRQPSQEWLATVHRAWLTLLDGRLAEAEDLISRARTLGEHAQSWSAEVSYGLQLFVLRRDQGRLEEIEDLVRSSAERYPRYPIWQCVLVETLAELGHETEARALLEELAADDFARLPFDEEWLVGLTLLAEATTLLRDTERAETIYRLLLPYEDRVAVSYPEISTGSVAHYLGILASALGRIRDAARHFEAALEMNGRIGARPWLARTRLDYARALVDHGDPTDAERAEELEHAGRALANELGMEVRAPSTAA